MEESKVVVHVHSVRIGLFGYLTVAAICITIMTVAETYFSNK